ncbi:g6833 [Coccomyxa elongata]
MSSYSIADKPQKATIMRLSNIYGVLLVLAALMACCQAATRRHPDPSQCPRCPSGVPETAPPPGDFAFYFLVRQWPDEFCYKQQGCSTIPDPAAGFTLHGLWPNLDNACQKDYPEHCSYRDGFDAFDVSTINQATLTSMEQNWPSYTTANECFWEHEWDCHGSCSGLAQQDYFQGVLDLHSKYDISAALSAANIEPSNQPVSTRDFEQALRDSFGVTPYLYCEHSSGQDYINEVFMCFTKDLRAVDCEQVCTVHPCEPRSSQDCGTELIYKLSNVRSKPQKPCTGSFRQCRPKSGTCAD